MPLSFSEYLTESNTMLATGMEDIIIQAVNGERASALHERISKHLRTDFGLPIGDTDCRSFKVGIAQTKVTDQWKQYFPDGNVPPSTQTPKTDVCIISPRRNSYFGTSRIKISVKTGKSAQLMSASKFEALATFKTALKKSRLDKEFGREIEELIHQFVTKGISKGNVGAGKKENNQELIKISELHSLIGAKLSEAFNRSQKFRNEFAAEAMSGSEKFGNDIGSADFIMNISGDGSSIKIHRIRSNNGIERDENYITSVAEQLKPYVAFKSVSIKSAGIKTGEKSFWSTLRLGVMNEGFMGGASALVMKLSIMIRKALSQGLLYFLNYIGMEPVIRFNNRIKF